MKHSAKIRSLAMALSMTGWSVLDFRGSSSPDRRNTRAPVVALWRPEPGPHRGPAMQPETPTAYPPPRI